MCETCTRLVTFLSIEGATRSVLTLMIAQTLVHKHEEALKYYAQAQSYLESVECSIPPAILAQWREEEGEWLRKVVDIRNHKTLDNPFVAPPDGECPKYLSW